MARIKRRQQPPPLPALRLVPPPAARRTDPDTSHAAAEALGDLTVWWSAILRFYADHDRRRGWNSYEVAQRLDLGECPWKRVSECLHHGWLELALDRHERPIKRPGKTNRMQRAYRISEAGERIREGR